MTRITDSFVFHAQQHPEQLAVVSEQQALTYGELLQRVGRVAEAIATFSEPHSHRARAPWVGILLSNRMEFLELFLGTAMAGGVAMVLNPDWAQPQLQAILNRWPPDLLVSDVQRLQAIENIASIEAIALDQTSPNFPTYESWLNYQPNTTPNETNPTEKPPSPTAHKPDLNPSNAKRPDTSHAKPLCRGGLGELALFPQSGGLGGDAPPSQVFADHDSGLQGDSVQHSKVPHILECCTEPPCKRELQLPTETPFYIGFTSGTTGHPKGIIRSHTSWLHSFAASRKEFNINPTDRVLVPGSLVHSLSLYTAIEALAMGATLHILPAFTPKAVLQQLNSSSITRLVAVPTILKAITNAAHSIQFPHLKTVIVGGSKLSPALRQQLANTFPNADILEYYGASELSFVSIASSCESIPPESVGRPFHNVTVSVQKDDGSGAAAPGEMGWIGIRSTMVCSGYLEPQKGNGFRFEQGWATVGDRGYIDTQGFLYLVGRERDMLISNGINVYPSEIETVLLQLPQIENAVVLGLPDDCRGDLICAVITWNGSERLKRITLMNHITAQLDRAKCPRRFFAVESLPTTSSGKIARSQLQTQILQGNLFHQELR